MPKKHPQLPELRSYIHYVAIIQRIKHISFIDMQWDTNDTNFIHAAFYTTYMYNVHADLDYKI